MNAFRLHGRCRLSHGCRLMKLARRYPGWEDSLREATAEAETVATPAPSAPPHPVLGEAAGTAGPTAHLQQEEIGGEAQDEGGRRR